MTTTRKQYLGVKYDLVMTLPSRFSEGKVHLLVYDKRNKCWFVSCAGFANWHTMEVSEPRPKNCDKCDHMIRKIFG
jgi:hypothetical protein